MRTKEEHIQFWIDQAQDDWGAVDNLFIGRKFLQSLFFAHLVIEKICKAIWIKYNTENVPPRSHNLLFILSTTPIQINENFREFILTLSRFQIEGRYPEYLSNMHLICNEQFTAELINKTNEIRLWLLEKLQ